MPVRKESSYRIVHCRHRWLWRHLRQAIRLRITFLRRKMPQRKMWNGKGVNHFYKDSKDFKLFFCHLQCLQMRVKRCHCGLKEKELPCYKDFHCETKCKRMKDCRRHPCNRKVNIEDISYAALNLTDLTFP